MGVRVGGGTIIKCLYLLWSRCRFINLPLEILVEQHDDNDSELAVPS